MIFDSKCRVWLTNDHAYWNPDYPASYYIAFHAPEGSVKSGEMYFEALNKRTGKPPQIYGASGYNKPVILKGSYNIRWHEYSDLDVLNGLFKYAIVQIP